jgi:hypothetical protein
MAIKHWASSAEPLRDLTDEEKKKYPGIQTQRHVGRDGVRREYRYFRANSARISGEPGTPEFEASYAAAKLGLMRKSQRGGETTYVYFVQCTRLFCSA